MSDGKLCPECDGQLDAPWHSTVHEMWEVGRPNREEAGHDKYIETMFNNKECALDMMYALLKLVETMAKRYSIPFLGLVQPDEDWIGTFRYFPENVSSELRSAWRETGLGSGKE